MKLYRVASRQDPYFGKGSYWALSVRYARIFQAWAEGTFMNPFPEPAGTRRLYTATAVEADVCNLLGPMLFVPPEKVEALCEAVTDRGFRWLVFYPEGAWMGSIYPEAVYLGDEPVEAELVSAEEP